MTHWYCLLTKPQREFDAEYLMERAGIEVLVPFRIEYRRPNRYRLAKREVRFPLMRGYIFAGFETQTPPWFTVLTEFRSVLRGVLGHHGAPYRFPDGAITALAEMSASRAPMPWRKMHTHREFNEGESVTILSGPFKDFTGKVEEIRGSHARCLLEIFSNATPVDVDLWNLAKAS